MNFIPGKVVKFNASDVSIRIPHMGWNEISIKNQVEIVFLSLVI